jgi:HEAT repeat protein
LNSFLLSFAVGWTTFAGAEEVSTALAKRVHRHLLIQDVDSAIQDAKKFIENHPDSLELQLAYLEALCQKGEEVEAFEQFSSLWKQKQDQINQRLVSEWLAWGVLSKGKESTLPMVRLYSLLGATFTQDARALPIFLKELRGSNSLLRSIAAKLAASYGDEPLQQELLRLLKEEPVWFVRLEVIRSLGALRVIQAKKTLCDIIASSRSLAEERANAMIALVSMYDQLQPEELDRLILSNRAGLRHLASELIAHFNDRTHVDQLIPLLQDDSPDVRISAMTTLGLLSIKNLKNRSVFSYIEANLQSSIPEVAITAGWLSMLLQQEEGKQTLLYWMGQERIEYRRLAAAAIAATGSVGASLALESMQKEIDPYIQATFAMGLIRQRKEVSLAAETLFKVFSKAKQELWMWQEGVSPLFRHLVPSKVEYVVEVPSYPKMVDQLVKLEILSYLSIVKHPRALEGVKSFLSCHEWGVTGAAAATLLQEGGEDSFSLIRELLQDPEENVKLQAALILAMFKHDPDATDVLMQSYQKADRDRKIHILEALGHIKDPRIAPFLVKVLQEPFQGLRVVAASALIQYLNQ